MRRTLMRTTAALVAGTAVTFTGLSVPATAQDDLGSRFTLGVLPDTQFYSRYSTADAGNLPEVRYGSEPFITQTQWLVDNQEGLNIPFATHLGDVVDQASVEQEWQVADEAIAVLDDGNLDYSILPGNHDVSETTPTKYTEYFPAERAAGNSTFGERYGVANQESEYHIFEAEGQEYLVLALAWRANEQTLDWAQGVIDANPDLPVILTSHEISNIDGAGNTYFSEEYGQGLWDSFIKGNDQIFLTMSGHHHGAGYHTTTNDAGNEVINILQDYQMAYQGGNGLLGLLQFDLTNNELEMTALSPWVAAKPQNTLNQFDDLILDGAGDSYVIDIDFAERFVAFDPEFTAGDANDPDYAQRAVEIVSEGYVPYTITDEDRPDSDSDYQHVEGTQVHWRPGQTHVGGTQLTDGQAVPEGAVVPDVENGDDMTFVEASEPGDVTYTDETHELSSDTGALQWNRPEDANDINYFRTADGAEINSHNFPNGYTFETFVKIDEDFNGDDHGWADAFIRDGRVTDTDPENGDTDPLVMLGVSDLRELRWWSYGENFEGFSNWSHEVPKGEWLHVAIVNDTEAGTVEMLIDGAPILRDGSGPEGLAGEDVAWIMGTSMDDGTPIDPWFGAIGETRIVDHPIESDQWLTARADADAPQQDLSSELSSNNIATSLLAMLGLIGIGGGLLMALEPFLSSFGIRF